MSKAAAVLRFGAGGLVTVTAILVFACSCYQPIVLAVHQPSSTRSPVLGHDEKNAVAGTRTLHDDIQVHPADVLEHPTTPPKTRRVSVDHESDDEGQRFPEAHTSGRPGGRSVSTATEEAVVTSSSKAVMNAVNSPIHKGVVPQHDAHKGVNAIEVPKEEVLHRFNADIKRKTLDKEHVDAQEDSLPDINLAQLHAEERQGRLSGDARTEAADLMTRVLLSAKKHLAYPLFPNAMVTQHLLSIHDGPTSSTLQLHGLQQTKTSAKTKSKQTDSVEKNEKEQEVRKNLEEERHARGEQEPLSSSDELQVRTGQQEHPERVEDATKNGASMTYTNSATQPASSHLETRQATTGTSEGGVIYDGHDYKRFNPAEGKERADEPLTPLRATQLQQLFKKCGWSAPDTLKDEAGKDKFIQEHFQTFVGRDLRNAFTSPVAYAELPRDLSTRSKRTVFVRILHEQADIFCESIILHSPGIDVNEGSAASAAASQSTSYNSRQNGVAGAGGNDPTVFDRHAARQPRFRENACIQSAERKMVCRNAFGEDLGRYVLANSQHTQNLKHRYAGQHLTDGDLTNPKSLALLPMFGSSTEEIFYTTPSETGGGSYCGMSRTELVEKFNSEDMRKTVPTKHETLPHPITADASAAASSSASAALQRRQIGSTTLLHESKVGYIPKDDAGQEDEQDGDAEDVEEEEEGDNGEDNNDSEEEQDEDENNEDADGSPPVAAAPTSFLQNTATTTSKVSAYHGNAAVSSSFIGASEGNSKKVIDYQHDFYKIADYEKACEQMCPDERHNNLLDVQQAAKNEITPDGIWMCVAALRFDQCKHKPIDKSTGVLDTAEASHREIHELAPVGADCFLEYLHSMLLLGRKLGQLQLPTPEAIETQLEEIQADTAMKLQADCKDWLGRESYSVGPVAGIHAQICDNGAVLGGIAVASADAMGGPGVPGEQQAGGSTTSGSGGSSGSASSAVVNTPIITSSSAGFFPDQSNEFMALNARFSILERKSYHIFLQRECASVQRRSPPWFEPQIWHLQVDRPTVHCSLHRVQARQARTDFMIRQFNKLPDYLSKNFIAKVLLNELDDASVSEMLGISRPTRQALQKRPLTATMVTSELLNNFRETINKNREGAKQTALQGEEHLDVLFARFLARPDLWPQQFWTSYASPERMAAYHQRKLIYLKQCKKLGLPLAFRDDIDPNSATGCTRETIKLQLQLRADEFRMNKEAERKLEEEAEAAKRARGSDHGARAFAFSPPGRGGAAFEAHPAVNVDSANTRVGFGGQARLWDSKAGAPVRADESLTGSVVGEVKVSNTDGSDTRMPDYHPTYGYGGRPGTFGAGSHPIYDTSADSAQNAGVHNLVFRDTLSGREFNAQGEHIGSFDPRSPGLNAGQLRGTDSVKEAARIPEEPIFGSNQKTNELLTLRLAQAPAPPEAAAIANGLFGENGPDPRKQHADHANGRDPHGGPSSSPSFDFDNTASSGTRDDSSDIGAEEAGAELSIKRAEDGDSARAGGGRGGHAPSTTGSVQGAPASRATSRDFSPAPHEASTPKEQDDQAKHQARARLHPAQGGPRNRSSDITASPAGTAKLGHTTGRNVREVEDNEDEKDEEEDSAEEDEDSAEEDSAEEGSDEEGSDEDGDEEEDSSFMQTLRKKGGSPRNPEHYEDRRLRTRKSRRTPNKMLGKWTREQGEERSVNKKEQRHGTVAGYLSSSSAIGSFVQSAVSFFSSSFAEEHTHEEQDHPKGPVEQAQSSAQQDQAGENKKDETETTKKGESSPEESSKQEQETQEKTVTEDSESYTGTQEGGHGEHRRKEPESPEQPPAGQQSVAFDVAKMGGARIESLRNELIQNVERRVSQDRSTPDGVPLSVTAHFHYDEKRKELSVSLTTSTSKDITRPVAISKDIANEILEEIAAIFTTTDREVTQLQGTSRTVDIEKSAESTGKSTEADAATSSPTSGPEGSASSANNGQQSTADPAESVKFTHMQRRLDPGDQSAGQGPPLIPWRDDGSDLFTTGDPGWLISIGFKERNDAPEAEADLQRLRFQLREQISQHISNLDPTQKGVRVFAKLTHSTARGVLQEVIAQESPKGQGAHASYHGDKLDEERMQLLSTYELAMRNAADSNLADGQRALEEARADQALEGLAARSKADDKSKDGTAEGASAPTASEAASTSSAAKDKTEAAGSARDEPPTPENGASAPIAVSFLQEFSENEDRDEGNEAVQALRSSSLVEQGEQYHEHHRTKHKKKRRRTTTKEGKMKLGEARKHLKRSSLAEGSDEEENAENLELHYDVRMQPTNAVNWGSTELRKSVARVLLDLVPAIVQVSVTPGVQAAAPPNGLEADPSAEPVTVWKNADGSASDDPVPIVLPPKDGTSQGEAEQKGSSCSVTLILVIFVLLLMLIGGVAVAWQLGYLDSVAISLGFSTPASSSTTDSATAALPADEQGSFGGEQSGEGNRVGGIKNVELPKKPPSASTSAAAARTSATTSVVNKKAAPNPRARPDGEAMDVVVESGEAMTGSAPGNRASNRSASPVAAASKSSTGATSKAAPKAAAGKAASASGATAGGASTTKTTAPADPRFHDLERRNFVPEAPPQCGGPLFDVGALATAKGGKQTKASSPPAGGKDPSKAGTTGQMPAMAKQKMPPGADKGRMLLGADKGKMPLGADKSKMPAAGQAVAIDKGKGPASEVLTPQQMMQKKGQKGGPVDPTHSPQQLKWLKGAEQDAKMGKMRPGGGKKLPPQKGSEGSAMPPKMPPHGGVKGTPTKGVQKV
ncbi:unnamed protein product [Amoebophrya sp. A25]|nr:unnamed protein product [Amoebophrya sp. A25]|eukprot:GSA25T00013438001.1